MLKIFNVDATNLYLTGNSYFLKWHALKDTELLNDENFERTCAGIGYELILDLNKCSSWTNKFSYLLNFNDEINNFLSLLK